MFRDPNSLLARYFKYKKPDEAEGFERALRLIVDAMDYNGLVQGQDWPHLNFRGRLNAHFIRDYRQDAEARWIQSLYDNVISPLNPWYAEGKISTPRISDSLLRNNVIEFIDGNNFKMAVLKHLANRCGVQLIEPITSNDLDMLNPLDAAFHFYKYIIKQMVTVGYKPENHPNDFNDFHLFFYLGLGSNYCFVAQEKKFKPALEQSSQKDQVKNFHEFMDFLQSKTNPKEET